MEIDIITQKVLDYKRTGTGLEELLNLLAERIYFSMPGGRYLSEDERSDFFCFFYPKLTSLIQRFQYNGISFTAYLNKTIRFQVKGFRISKIRENRLQKLYGSVLFWENVEEEELTYGVETCMIPRQVRKVLKIEGDGKIHDPAYQRRLLYLILKNAYFIDLESLDYLAVLGGFEPKWLLQIVEEIRSFLLFKEVRLAGLIKRRNLTLLKIYRLQELLTWSDESSKKELLFQIQKSRKRLAEYIADIRKVHFYPTNREISLITGIPKGTIDSSLFELKRRQKELSQEKELKYA